MSRRKNQGNAIEMAYNECVDGILTLNRIICFYSVGAAVTIANLLAFPLGSWLLPQDMWLQYILSFFVLFAAFLVAFMIPETRKTKQRTEHSIHATNHSHQVIAQTKPSLTLLTL